MRFSDARTSPILGHVKIIDLARMQLSQKAFASGDGQNIL
jgi:hypothetical protein